MERELGSHEKHPYKALSYVWGSSAVTDTIYLQGLEFRITLNLSCALRHLRKADEDTILWVDALVSTSTLMSVRRLDLSGLSVDFLLSVHQSA
jgi:hypothetical protein